MRTRMHHAAESLLADSSQLGLQSDLEYLGEMRDWLDELMAVNQVPDHTIKRVERSRLSHWPPRNN